ncbi:phosphatidylserine decarboxylase [Cytobacillus purgationiresistens]|uniref:Phosphatidylserine decarboxylase proenzyme n=1 Tax=Cytobacillus purgationiresistens TaxID=863449 RepID=A0ABU0AE55_9BACI|nr:phosphatidylserine decarboxylase [Cytobacillus purgationiresistens]MDQ0269533.1 phosphatidylserine decarboxylase [Cytobacillus purgationiresistens]
MKQSIYRAMIELTNGRFTSNLLYRFARSNASRFAIAPFSKTYRINEDEIENELKSYQTLHEFFIRKLKADARSIDMHEESIVSPVDAVIEDIGSIDQDRRIMVKEKEYSISEMLGGDEAASKYAGGTYMIFYLSPSHYHRIHSPVTGEINKQWTLGRKSFPVNKWGLAFGRDTLSKNYRKISEVGYEGGELAIVKVGAMFVNSIERTHEGDKLEKGKEMAYFSFGSTVILLFQKDAFQLLPSIQTPAHIRVGECIGHMV